MSSKPSYESLSARVEALEIELAALRKQDSAMIRILSEDFKSLADRSQDAIYQYDIESCTFPIFNKMFLALYGMETAGQVTLSPKSVLLHIHPADRENVRAARRQSYLSATNFGEIEYRFLHADGSQRVMHDRWTVVRDLDGQPVAIEGFIRDNTQVRQAEKEFELSMRHSLIGCYIVKEGRFQYVNPEFMRITGYTEQELIGTVPIRIVLPGYREQVRENFIHMLKAQRDFPYEFCIEDKYGNIKWILETATSIRYNGGRAALGYFMDISKSKEAESQRLEKEKLLSILEMAGAVGHELNNPLQVVLTCAEKLAPAIGDHPRNIELHTLLTQHIRTMKDAIFKFQNITRYAAKDYVNGKNIFDIDRALPGRLK